MSRIKLDYDYPIYYGVKNRYGYTISQLKVDYKNKTIEEGFFKQSVDVLFKTKKAFYDKFYELIILGFTKIKNDND